MKRVNNYKNNEKNYTTNTKIKHISHPTNIEYFFKKTINIIILYNQRLPKTIMRYRVRGT